MFKAKCIRPAAPWRFRALVLAVGIAAVHAPVALLAQTAAQKKPHPLVESVTFKGVKAVEPHHIQSTISTQPTTCRAFFLKPLCLLTHNHIFEARNYLDHDQLRRDVLRIKVFYWIRGYRHAQVDTVVADKKRGVAITFNVTEGPPTTISTVAVHQTRDSLSERSLRRWGLPAAGDPIDLTRLDTLNTHVRRTLWDMGHGNAVVNDTAPPIDSLHVALDVRIDAGPVTTVDTVIVEGNEKVTARTVGRLVGMGHGSLYKRADLLEAQRRLYRSDLFRQTLITVPDSADSAKTVVVSVREAGMHAFQLGGGASTVEFGQVQANYTLYNFMGTARRVELHSAVGNIFAPTLYGKRIFGAATPRGTNGQVDRAFLTPTWQLSGSMTQPWLFSTRNSLGITAFSNRRSIPGIVIDRGTGASATFTHAVKRDIPLSLTYRYERARIEAGDLYFCVDFGYCRQQTIQALQQTKSFSPLVLTLRADRTDDPLEPTTGYTARFDAEHASGITASDWRFNRVEAEFTPYLKLGKRVLVVRGHGGKVFGVGKDLLLHPRTRFYGGGARSVRGYAEGQLGPRVLTIDPEKLLTADTAKGVRCTEASIGNGSCDPNVVSSADFTPRPVGGNTLLEGTIEYRIPFGTNLGAAVFVDAGRVGASNLGANTGNVAAQLRGRSAITPGVGFRYLSPLGPVRIDLGLRPRVTEDLPVLTQVRDPDGKLRMVELATPKHYNPTEGPHGFLGGVTSHLQLHIYIGEAY